MALTRLVDMAQANAETESDIEMIQLMRPAERTGDCVGDG